MPPLPPEDIAQVLRDTSDLHATLRGQRILITGATGFFGRWLMESLLPLGAHLTAISRDPGRFVAANPHLGPSICLEWIQDSVTTLSASRLPLTRLDSVLHLATEASPGASVQSYREVIVDGTRRTLEVAAATGAKRFLFTSTGAMPGKYPGAVEKREAEQLCLAHPALGPTIARCYTFAGPGMPFDGKFAFGNFLRDALAGKPIVITGDGTPVRSYLYGSDLATWLITMMYSGRGEQATPLPIFEVGSSVPVSIRELAETVDRVVGGAGVVVRGQRAVTEAGGCKTPALQSQTDHSDCRAGVLHPPSAPSDRYLPRPDHALTDLGLRETVDLKTAIRKTANWLRKQ